MASWNKYAVGADMRKQAMFICRMLVRALPLWQPVNVSGYKSQQRFFRRWFPNAEIKMQRGCRFDTFPPRRAGSQATPGNPALEKNRSAVSKIIVC